jgi:hypothetical protein
VDGPELVESFIVAAVAAILTIRGLLAAFGYPSIGGRHLHIAHMLWGGLLMVVALLLTLGFVGRGVRHIAAGVGGIGFGTFIDELGKFVTRNNDYFYAPTVALIYALFVLLYIGVRALQRGRLTSTEALANALDLAQEAVRHDLDSDEKKRALELLARSDPSNPVVAPLTTALTAIAAIPPTRQGPLTLLRSRARSVYRWLVQRWWFPLVVVVMFVAHSGIALVQAALVAPRLTVVIALAGAALLAGGLGVGAYRRARPGIAAVLGLAAVLAAILGLGGIGWSRRGVSLSFFEAADLVSSVLPAIIVVVGVLRLPSSRLEAYQTFRRAVLILIFLTQFFVFYRDKFLGLVGLFWNILILLTLRYMIAQELGMQDAAQPGRRKADPA